MKASLFLVGVSLCEALGGGASLRSSALSALDQRGSPPTSELIINVTGSVGASIASTQGSFSRSYFGSTLCDTFGDNSQQAIMKMDANQHYLWDKGFVFKCPFKFNFPNANSGSCECNISFSCHQKLKNLFSKKGLFGTDDWFCKSFKLDCGANVCAKLSGEAPSSWNANQDTKQFVSIVPFDATNPNASPAYDGGATASWVNAGSGSSVSLMQSTTFTSSVAKANAETNTLSINIGKIAFMGGELGASATHAVTNTITTTITNTAVTQKTCVTPQCATEVWQGSFIVYTEDHMNSITVNTCNFACCDAPPTCAPGDCGKNPCA